MRNSVFCLIGVGTGTLQIRCDESEDVGRQPDVVLVCSIFSLCFQPCLLNCIYLNLFDSHTCIPA